MILASFIILGFYFLLILYYSNGIVRHNDSPATGKDKINGFSVIIPFRNEREHLPGLLNSIAIMDYPKDQFEVILVNDASDDGSEKVALDFSRKHPTIPLRIVDNIITSNSPKKDAISSGIDQAKFPWIVTTDADCLVPALWLQSFDRMIQEQTVKMLVAPVTYSPKKGFLHDFQLLDFLSLQGITMGSFGNYNGGFNQPFLCNGANLCYQKQVFKDLKGFEGNRHVASGDDVFLLQKIIKEFPSQVRFVKSKGAIIQTADKDSVKELFEQRIRWASKTAAYVSPWPKIVGVLVLATNLLIVLALVLGLAGQLSWGLIGVFFLLKFNIDFILLMKTSLFFGQEPVMKSYFISSLLHPFFIVIVAFISFFKGYSWKGRKYA